MLEMKLAVGVLLLGATLAGSAHAVESGAPAAPTLGKDPVTQAPLSATKKSQAVQGRKAKPSRKAAPKAKKKLDSMTETPPDSADQSVRLRGVRG
jgi:hypothetical protein